MSPRPANDNAPKLSRAEALQDLLIVLDTLLVVTPDDRDVYAIRAEVAAALAKCGVRQ